MGESKAVHDFPRDRDEVMEAAKHFLVASGGLRLDPTVMMIPRGMEDVLRSWDANEYGSRETAASMRAGARPGRMFGMRLVWDAPCFRLAWVPDEPP